MAQLIHSPQTEIDHFINWLSSDECKPVAFDYEVCNPVSGCVGKHRYDGDFIVFNWAGVPAATLDEYKASLQVRVIPIHAGWTLCYKIATIPFSALVFEGDE